MPRRPAPLPAPLQNRSFSTADALGLGVSAERLRRLDLARPYHGVRVPIPLAATVRARAQAFAQRMPAGWYFSHWTAAVLLGLRVPAHPVRDPNLHVSAPAGRRAPKGRGVCGHSGDAATVEVGGLPLSAPVDTWLRLAPLMTLDEAVVLADGLLRRTRPIATRDQLEDAVAGWAGRRGAALLARAMPLVRARTDSARETMLRLLVVRSGLPEPEINYPIRNRYGAVIAHGDLAYPRYRVLLEYDGEQHRETEQYFVDIDRLDGIMEEGWRIIRINRRHFAAPGRVLERIRRALLDTGWGP